MRTGSQGPKQGSWAGSTFSGICLVVWQRCFLYKNWRQITAEGLTCSGRLWAGDVQLGPRICMVSLRASGNRVCGCFAGDSVPMDYGFKDHHSAKQFLQGSYHRNYDFHEHYAQFLHNDRGAYLKILWGIFRFDISSPKDELPPGPSLILQHVPDY